MNVGISFGAYHKYILVMLHGKRVNVTLYGKRYKKRILDFFPGLSGWALIQSSLSLQEGDRGSIWDRRCWGNGAGEERLQRSGRRPRTAWGCPQPEETRKGALRNLPKKRAPDDALIWAQNWNWFWTSTSTKFGRICC